MQGEDGVVGDVWVGMVVGWLGHGQVGGLGRGGWVMVRSEGPVV